MNKFSRFIASPRALMLALATLPVVSFAQAVDPFTAAMTDVTAKIGTYGAALVGLSAVGVVFAIAIKYVKKIRGAA